MAPRSFYYLLVFALLFSLHSCTFEKRVHSRGFHVEWLSHKKPKQTKPALTKRAKPADETHAISKPDSSRLFPHHSEAVVAYAEEAFIPVANLAAISLQTDCDLMILRSGEEVQAKIYEVNAEEIKYKKCDNLSGPDYYISKSQVFMIKYANGVKEVFETTSKPQPENKPAPRTGPGRYDARVVPGSAIAAFVLGLLTPFLYITGIPALILGISSLKKIDRNPELYKGRGYSITAIAISSIYILLFVILLLFLFIFLMSFRN